jgi:hypothetical protein
MSQETDAGIARLLRELRFHWSDHFGVSWHVTGYTSPTEYERSTLN